MARPSEDIARRAVGRPSEYDPQYCEYVVELGKLGKSKAYIAAQIGVARQTLENWAREHPEFLDAITRAMALSQAWWEDAGQAGMTADKFNSSVWSRSMAARFPEDWRETTRQEQTGANGGPIQTVDLSKASDDDLNRLASLLGVAVEPGASGELADPDTSGDDPPTG